jgi:MAF protein
LAQRLALEKALAVARLGQQGLVLGADTVVVVDGVVLGKPHGPQEARQMLLTLWGRAHQVVTGVALVEAATGRFRAAFQTSQVTMRPYTAEEVDRYVASGEPLDKAGAYAVQDPTFHPAVHVEGCYSNVVGLPLCTLAGLLRELGGAVALQRPWAPPLGCGECPLYSLTWTQGHEHP